MFWQYSKIVVLNTSFFEKIMEICFINAAYLPQICLILASYMMQVWLWRRLNDTALYIYLYLCLQLYISSHSSFKWQAFNLMVEIEFNFPFLSRFASSLQLFGALVVNLMREGRDHVTMLQSSILRGRYSDSTASSQLPEYCDTSLGTSMLGQLGWSQFLFSQHTSPWHFMVISMY